MGVVRQYMADVLTRAGQRTRPGAVAAIAARDEAREVTKANFLSFVPADRDRKYEWMADHFLPENGVSTPAAQRPAPAEQTTDASSRFGVRDHRLKGH